MSPRRIALIAVAAALAIAAVAVVSDLTGGKVTNGHGAVLPTSALVGEHVRNFSLPGLRGGVERAPWTLGRASVLIFFASWCTPCQGEIPKVAAYLRSHDPSPVEVLGIDANDERGAALNFVRRDGVTFPVAFDANGNVTSEVFGFEELPESVFINAKGVVTEVYFGAIPEAKLARGIRSLRPV